MKRDAKTKAALPTRGRVVRTPAVIRRVWKLRDQGIGLEEIARTITGEGTKISKGSVHAIISAGRPDSTPPVKRRPAVAKPAAVTARPPRSAPAPRSEPSRETEQPRAVTDPFVRDLLEDLRDARDLAAKCKAEGDAPGQARALALAGKIAAMLQKANARAADEGDVVRVKRAEIQATADRAFSALAAMVENIVATRATWPRCESCGEAITPPEGFGDGEKSAIRSLLERAALGAPS